MQYASVPEVHESWKGYGNHRSRCDDLIKYLSPIPTFDVSLHHHLPMHCLVSESDQLIDHAGFVTDKLIPLSNLEYRGGI